MRCDGGQVIQRGLRGALVGCALIGLLACTGTPPPAGPTDEPRAEVSEELEQSLIEAHQALIRAYEAKDVEGFIALLDSSPALLIFHPAIENRFDGIDEVRQQLPRMFASLEDPSWTDVHPTMMISGDTAWLTSQVLIKSGHMSAPFVGRGTEIWMRQGDDWRLIHGHWSEHAKLASSLRGE